MDAKEAITRFGGIPLVVLGMAIVIISLFYVSGKESDLWNFFLRAGFGLLLIGLLMLFLFSIRTVPREVSTSFLMTQGRNTGRMLEAMNLHGRGVYFPPVGRLREDRVYVPLEKHDLPLPDISDDTVFNVGSTTPSMGVAMIPPGKDFVDMIETMTSSRFSKDQVRDGTEALEKLSKGTGMFRSLSLREREDRLELQIKQDKSDLICKTMWKEYPMLHSQVGCPLCSSVLCATSRIASLPLRIISVERRDDAVIFSLERVIR